MTKEKIEPTNNAMDKSFRYTGDQWGKDFHKNLKLPGIFKEFLQNDTHKDPKTGIRMDLLELSELEKGNEILINIEHQSTQLNTDKIRIIDDYKNYSKCKHKLPLLTVIVSPYSKKEQINEYRSTDSDILRPIFITIDDDEIEKRLNILKANIKNKNIENSIVLNIAIISIFVLNNKYETLKQLCIILKKSIGIKGKIKRDMTKVLEEMIIYKLQSNENQVKELLEMLDEEIEIAKRGIRIWYEEEFEQIKAQHQKELNQKNIELNQTQAQHQKELNQTQAQHQKELNQTQAQHQKELAEKDKKIAELTAQLKTNNLN